MIDNVIFDLDGTLVDSLPGVEYSTRAAWDAVQPGMPCPSLLRLIGPPIREMFHRALPAADPALLDALVYHFRASYDAEGWQKTVVFPDVLAALAALTGDGIRCFVVTNKPSVAMQRIVHHCGLRPFLTANQSVDSRTPPFASKAEATALLVAEHRVDRARTVLMGDTLEDARAAHACGLYFIAFRGGYGWPDLEANLPEIEVCERFEGLPSLLRRLGARAHSPRS
jgi:phosphoglycolate phosphatase